MEDNLAESAIKITFSRASITDIEVVRQGHARSGGRAWHLVRIDAVPRSVKPHETNKIISISTAPHVLVAAKELRSEWRVVSASKKKKKKKQKKKLRLRLWETHDSSKSRPCHRQPIFGLTASPFRRLSLSSSRLWSASTVWKSSLALSLFQHFWHRTARILQFGHISGVLSKFCTAFLEGRPSPLFLRR